MSIFQREGGDSPSQAGNPSRRAATPGTGGQTTVVAAGSRVNGEISGATDVLIDGQVDGQVVLGASVVVGEAGEVKGQIQARRVKIGGKVQGDIRASERIEVMASGRIEGDVIAPRVAINAGAFFKGKVEMTSAAADSKPQAHSKPEAPSKADMPSGPEAPSKPEGQSPPASEAKGQPEQKRLDDTGSGSPSSAAAES